MTPEPCGLARPIQQIARQLADTNQTDGQLLARFLALRDEEAFAALVRRHAPMVLGVCRRVLRNHADADDAFQASFVVLLRKASSLTGRATVGDWLHGVAFHTALKARAVAAKRRTKEAQAVRFSAPEPDDRLEQLDREVLRLPARYREPVVLCELEGRPRAEVAGLLGVAEGTLSSRLAHARKVLATRLREASALTALVVAVSSERVQATVRAASGPVSPAIAKLVHEVTHAMFLTKLRSVVLLTFTTAVALAAAIHFAPSSSATPSPSLRTAPRDVTVKQLIKEKDAVVKKLIGTWEVKKQIIDDKEVDLPVEYEHYTFGEHDIKIEFKIKDGELFDKEFGFNVNPTTSPPEMTIHGPKQLVLAIYELDGDTLKIAAHGISELERPRSFAVKDKRIADMPLSVRIYERKKK